MATPIAPVGFVLTASYPEDARPEVTLHRTREDAVRYCIVKYEMSEDDAESLTLYGAVEDPETMFAHITHCGFAPTV